MRGHFTPMLVVFLLLGCVANDAQRVWLLPTHVGGETLVYSGVERPVPHPGNAQWQLQAAQQAGAESSRVFWMSAFTSDQVGYRSHYVTVIDGVGRDLIKPTIELLMPPLSEVSDISWGGRALVAVRPLGGTSVVYFYAFGSTMAMVSAPTDELVREALDQIRLSSPGATQTNVPFVP